MTSDQKNDDSLDAATVLVDCEAGRKLGCGTLCCRLMVPISQQDVDNGLEVQSPISGLLRQDKDGYCHYLNRDSMRCTVWDKRPLVCRMYDCNLDPKLQAVLREGFQSFTQVIATGKSIDAQDWVQIPLVSKKNQEG